MAEADARSEVFQVGFRLDGAVGWVGWAVSGRTLEIAGAL